MTRVNLDELQERLSWRGRLELFPHEAQRLLDELRALRELEADALAAARHPGVPAVEMSPSGPNPPGPGGDPTSGTLRAAAATGGVPDPTLARCADPGCPDRRNGFTHMHLIKLDPAPQPEVET